MNKEPSASFHKFDFESALSISRWLAQTTENTDSLCFSLLISTLLDKSSQVSFQNLREFLEGVKMKGLSQPLLKVATPLALDMARNRIGYLPLVLLKPVQEALSRELRMRKSNPIQN